METIHHNSSLLDQFHRGAVRRRQYPAFGET